MGKRFLKGVKLCMIKHGRNTIAFDAYLNIIIEHQH
jgi:hypothetical protein